MQPLSLHGRVACVTGAARGIGRAIAIRFAELGADVLMTDILQAELDESVSALVATGARGHGLLLDVSSAAAGERLVAVALSIFGRLDVLVNNAAVLVPGRVLDTDAGEWDRMMDLDLKGAFFCAQAAARHMAAAGRGGSIVNIAAMGGFIPTGCSAIYDTAKGGVLAMTRSLAKELGPAGIRVNSIAPGSIDTPGAATIRPAIRRMSGAPSGAAPVRSVLGRVGTAEDVANAAAYLASDLAAYVTGIVLPVDGGYALI